MLKKKPIGFFDSGYGGLTILKEVQELLPQFDYIYLGDNNRAPYGTKDADTVFQFTWECVQKLFKKNCDLVILACNTASAKALRRIQQTKLKNFPGKRVLGVIRPSAEIVGDFSQTNHITVLGTPGTVSSNTYIEEFAFFSPQTTVHQYACPEWVALVENQAYNSEKGSRIIENDLKNVLNLFPKTDVLLLGCTHYPVLKHLIKQFIPENILIVSQGKLVAESLKLYLQRHTWMTEKLSDCRTSIYYTTGETAEFDAIGSKILRVSVKSEKINI